MEVKAAPTWKGIVAAAVVAHSTSRTTGVA
jgi:hypothetical protein